MICPSCFQRFLQSFLRPAVMKNNEPLALFITWTVYGTFLPGDSRCWRKRNRGEQPPQPALAQWHLEHLNHPILLLTPQDRTTVEDAIDEITSHRDWHLWAKSARSNHVHLVVTAADRAPRLVRDQIKAKCTHELRVKNRAFQYRMVWTTGGDIEFLYTEEEVDLCVEYVAETQDRKGQDL